MTPKPLSVIPRQLTVPESERLPERKRVTLISAFRSPSIAVILADSQETVKDRRGHEWKYAILKIKPEKFGHFSMSIAGSGNGDHIDSFLEIFRRTLAKSKHKTLLGFRKLFESDFRKCKSKLLKDDSVKANMHFIVAAQIKGKFEVWRTVEGTLVPIDESKPILLGFKTNLYQHVANTLHSGVSSIPQVMLAGLRVLELARQTATCVDRPYSGVIVGAHSIIALDDKLLGEMVESLAIFGGVLDTVLLSCADTSEQTSKFTQRLREFERTALALRKEYLQAIGEMDAKKRMADGVGYGIALTPPGTVTTLRLNPPPGKKEFEIEENPEKVREFENTHRPPK